MFMPPTALRKLLFEGTLNQFILEDLDVIMCGEEPLPADTEKKGERTLDCTVHETYSQTEATALIGESDSLYSTPLAR